MLHVLEAKGVRVFSLAENTRNVDAFSSWREERPFVFLNMQKTAERSRFDAAHELGTPSSGIGTAVRVDAKPKTKQTNLPQNS